MTQEQVETTIASLPTKSDDELVYIWKCCISEKSTAARNLLKPLVTAIEATRKKNSKKQGHNYEEEPTEQTA